MGLALTGASLTEAQGHLGLSWLPGMPLGTAAPQAAATAVSESQEISVLIALFKWCACSSLWGDLVFVATANDRATEKDCLFLEWGFSLKEIKINIKYICISVCMYAHREIYIRISMLKEMNPTSKYSPSWWKWSGDLSGIEGQDIWG